MAYMHIENLYKNQTILMFKECYALEKIHGTSAHISWDIVASVVDYFPGGIALEKFKALFDHEWLGQRFREMVPDKPVRVYGEAYGGSCQRMSHLYGPDLKFVVFDVRVDDVWLNVPKASAFVKQLGLEFVAYRRLFADIAELDVFKESDSVQALRNGVDVLSAHEGIVLRPLEEMTLNDGARVIAKHKGDAFKETKSPRKVEDPEKLKVLEDAKAIAEEWVTEERLNHVLDAVRIERDIENAGTIIKAMQADVFREAAGEVIESDAARKAIGRATVSLLKAMP